MPKQANSVLFAVKILYFLALAVPKPKNSESKTRFEIMDLLAPVSGKATTVEKGGALFLEWSISEIFTGINGSAGMGGSSHCAPACAAVAFDACTTTVLA